MALIDDVVIAAPCPMSWDAMTGDDTVRHCAGCAKNVYNIADMTEAEAEKFFQKNGANQCIRLFRRNDGKLMTDNCPRGLRAIRNRMRLVVKIGAAVAASIFAFVPGWRGMPADAQQADVPPHDAEGLKGDVYIPPKKNPAAASTLPLSGEPMMKTPAIESRGNMAFPVAQPGAKKIMIGGECPSSGAKPTATPSIHYMGRHAGTFSATPEPNVKPFQGQSIANPVVKGSEAPKADPNGQSGDFGVIKKDLKDKKSDSGAYKLYLQAAQNESNGNLLLAKVQYKDAINAAKLQNNGDPNFLKLLMRSSNNLELKLANNTESTK